MEHISWRHTQNCKQTAAQHQRDGRINKIKMITLKKLAIIEESLALDFQGGVVCIYEDTKGAKTIRTLQAFKRYFCESKVSGMAKGVMLEMLSKVEESANNYLEQEKFTHYKKKKAASEVEKLLHEAVTFFS